MVSALIAAAAAAIIAFALSAFVLRTQRVRSDERIRSILEQVDRTLGTISEILGRVVARTVEVRAVRELELTVDLDELLRRLAAETTARTGADAALVQVRGVHGQRASAAFGADARTLRQPPLGAGARPFRALTINWAYRSATEHADDALTSILVVPIVEEGVETGTIAAYAREETALDARAVRALEQLAAQAGPAVESARRYSESELALTDVATGLRNRQGWDVELERAVDRARASGLPLSVLVLRAGEVPGAADEDALDELAALLARHTRGTDVVCRTSPGEVGVLLPDTSGEAMRRFYVRLRDQAGRAVLARHATFAAGLVEWRPNESGDALHTRAVASVGRSRVEELVVGGGRSAADPRDMFDARLAQAVDRAQRLGEPLSLVALGLDLGASAPGEHDPERMLHEVESRLAASLSNGDTTCRVAPDELVVMLPGSSPVQAEQLLAVVRPTAAGPGPSAGERPFSAGITEVVRGDDAQTALERAEGALRQARHAGRGTVVVAMPNGGERPA